MRRAIRLAIVALCIMVIVAIFIFTYGEVSGAMAETFWGRVAMTTSVTFVVSAMLLVLAMVFVAAMEWVMEPSKESDND